MDLYGAFETIKFSFQKFMNLTQSKNIMHQIKLLAITLLLGITLPGCNINPSKKAQTQIFSEGGSGAPTTSVNSLTRSYDYHEVSQDAMLKRMRKQ